MVSPLANYLTLPDPTLKSSIKAPDAAKMRGMVGSFKLTSTECLLLSRGRNRKKMKNKKIETTESRGEAKKSCGES